MKVIKFTIFMLIICSSRVQADDESNNKNSDLNLHENEFYLTNEVYPTCVHCCFENADHESESLNLSQKFSCKIETFNENIKDIYFYQLITEKLLKWIENNELFQNLDSFLEIYENGKAFSELFI